MDLFAIADEAGAIEGVYGSEAPLGDWLRGVSITGDLVVWWAETSSDGLTYLAGAQMVNLATATVPRGCRPVAPTRVRSRGRRTAGRVLLSPYGGAPRAPVH